MQLERAHLERLLVWGAASVIAGTAIIALLVVRRVRSPLLLQFGIQMLLFGAGAVAIARVRGRAVPLRDLASATRLDQILSFEAGLDVGVIAVGVALALCAVQFGRRQGPLGAGVALVTQGAALLALHGRLLSQLRV